MLFMVVFGGLNKIYLRLFLFHWNRKLKTLYTHFRTRITSPYAVFFGKVSPSSSA